MKMPLKETKKKKMKVKPGTINLPEIELSETTRNNNKKEENNNSNNNNNETNQSSKNVTKTTKSPFPTISISKLSAAANLGPSSTARTPDLRFGILCIP